MRHDQGTGTDPYWSATQFSQVHWLGTARRVLTDTPAWVLIVTGAVVLVVLLLVQYLTVRKIVADRKRTAAEQQRVRETEGAEAAQMLGGMGPAGRVALGGVLVSLYGLWGFATGTAQLPFLVAIGFCAMFDVLELQLFRLLYQTADPRKGKTPQYKLMHSTAWGLVSLSATANFVHAPNAVSAPFMAVMPAAAAWVIELELRKRMAGSEKVEDDKGSGGPIRLVIKIWHKVWAAIYGAAGIDPGEKNSEMAQKALGRKAAKRAYELRLSLERQQDLQKQLDELKDEAPSREKTRRVGDLQAELDTLAKHTRRPRIRAQKMLMRGDLHEPAATLELLRRMAWLTRTDDVALLTYGPDSKAKQVMEELNIAANADFVEASNRAAEIEARAAEVDEARQQAEEAVKAAQQQLALLLEEVEATKKNAADAAEQTAKEVEKEKERLRLLREERASLESSDATAGQLYQKAVKELEQAREQLTALMEERGKLTDTTSGAREEVLRLEGVQKTLEERLGTAAEERDRLTTAASDAQREAREAREQVLRLEERLASVERLQTVGVPARAQQSGRVDARIGSAGGDTRQRIRDLLAEMSPEERAQSQRKVAGQLMDRVGLSLDGVRIHLRAIDQEDEQAGVPGPRTHEDPADTDDEDGEK
ncbi:hypothetical protein OOK58_59140 [Streptomyces sp. NBC_01728]|uniref:hypothetical protein n=1 Tax=unclassified Streptomyces TaxID=2593676 RepID=UPI002255DFCA|nr:MULTISPECIES: hypothetical protein [unclassified Streptomyces]MCX4462426.1 hypothetical protein [Streptomyces sp. NBC_01719]MCX4500856.1 hypothetical protein [Streptomyces sp. NBC_01728]